VTVSVGALQGRPLPLTLAAWAFILTGAGGILKDIVPLVTGGAPARQGLLAEGASMLAVIWFIRALAVVGGVGVLGGRRWARWLLVAWMVFHVGISLFHSIGEALAHVLIFAALTYAMYRRPSAAWFTEAEPVSRT
jgi:hypothetical protein